jgi:transcription elongation factor/antiterminator RfaH
MNSTNPINSMNSTNPMNPQWYVIQTKPANEHRVETNLSNQGIEVFLPLLESFQYSSGKMIPKVKPLFPNYVFATLDINLHYYKVRWTRGVNKILGNGGGPLPISGKVIQAIRDRMGENHLVRLDEGLEEGTVVQFTSGPFKGLMGVFDRRMSEGKRVRVLLSLIGVDVPVQVSRYQIKKVA